MPNIAVPLARLPTLALAQVRDLVGHQILLAIMLLSAVIAQTVGLAIARVFGRGGMRIGVIMVAPDV
jgi:hypothetical protein